MLMKFRQLYVTGIFCITFDTYLTPDDGFHLSRFVAEYSYTVGFRLTVR